MSKDTGGPAFPVRTAMFDCTQPGMTLRDYFAIHASEEDIQRHLPTGRVIDVVIPNGFGGKSVEKRSEYRTREQARYAFADDMLKAREA